MTISSDCITFLPDGEAWLVLEGHAVRGERRWDSRRYMSDLDRPCSTCGGTRKVPGMNRSPGDLLFPCPACNGTGRHTFDLEVEADYFLEPTHHHVLADVHRVSVIEGMVPPIVADYDESGPFPLIVQDEDLRFYLVTAEDEAAGSDGAPITLPPAAAPGMFAVKLKVSPVL